MPIGKIEAFDEANEDWSTYCEIVEQYFLANEIKEDKQVPAILSLINSKAYGFCEDCVHRGVHQQNPRLNPLLRLYKYSKSIYH
jgi:hypothetical protein